MHLICSHVPAIAESVPAESIIVKSLTLSLLSASAAGGGLLDVTERCALLNIMNLMRTALESRRGYTETHEPRPKFMKLVVKTHEIL